jgi:hypothetical protein
MRVAVFRALLIGCVGTVGANAFGGLRQIARSPVVDGSPAAAAVTRDRHDPLRWHDASAAILRISLDRELVVLPPLGMPGIPPSRRLESRPTSIQPGLIDSSPPPAILLEPLAITRPHDRITIEPYDASWENESIAAPLPAPLWPPLIVFLAAWGNRTFRRIVR